MAITKQFLKSRPECKVKFSVTPEEANGAQKIAVVGDFNDWDPAATALKKQKNGKFSATVTFPAGYSGKFRYLADGVRWFNDPEADGYEYCSFAEEENSLLQL